MISVDPEFLGADELAGLEDSLRASGNQAPVVLWAGPGVLLDGHNRYDICQRLGIPLMPPVEVNLPSRDHAKLWIKENQLGRRNLRDDQRAIIADEVREARSALAIAERAERANEVKYGRASSLSDTLTDKEPGRDTRAEIARETGLPERKLRYAAEVRKTAPELADKVREGRATLIEAMRDIRQAAIVQRHTSIAARKAKELAGIYDVIVADPPWPQKKIGFAERLDAGEPLDYPVMALEEIEREVGEKLARHTGDDCHVFLWTTQRFLPAAIRLLEAWGLRYVCLFTWKKPAGVQPLGLPCFNSEFVVYARKGSPHFIETKAFPTCFDAPRGAHSEKPQEFYAMLCRCTAGMRRLDLFNRRAIEGFERWGNEAQE